jgi:hypothetical protein
MIRWIAATLALTLVIIPVSPAISQISREVTRIDPRAEQGTASAPQCTDTCCWDEKDNVLVCKRSTPPVVIPIKPGIHGGSNNLPANYGKMRALNGSFSNTSQGH